MERLKHGSARALPLLLACASLALSLILAECVVRFTQFAPAERKMGAAALWASFQNFYVQAVLDPGTGCGFVDSLVAHPYLGFVHHRLPPCGIPGSNNVGVVDKSDLPLERDSRYFTVLVLGGSVAGQLAVGRGGGAACWLEEFLNGKYVSPNGRPFRVVSGALGAWRLPAQVVMLSLYGDGVDAAIAVDGYNEASATSWGGRIDYPDVANYLSVSRPRQAGWDLAGIRLLQRLRRDAYSLPVVRNSFLAYFAFNRLLAYFSGRLNGSSADREILGRYFSFPRGWDDMKRQSWNRSKYKNYVRILNHEARAMHVRYAHFLQPVRWFDKDLTEEERSYREFISPKNYEAIFVRGGEELRREGYPVFSLLDIFKGIKETVYGDWIHCKFGPDGDSLGYRIMSRRIASDLALAWDLRRKP